MIYYAGIDECYCKKLPLLMYFMCLYAIYLQSSKGIMLLLLQETAFTNVFQCLYAINLQVFMTKNKITITEKSLLCTMRVKTPQE